MLTDRDRMEWCLFGSVVVLILSSAPVFALSGKEHISIANDGLRLAHAYAKEKAILSEAELRSLETLLPENACPNESYGDFVSAVDYVLNPVELFEQYGQIQCLPGSIREIANRPRAGRWTKLLNHLRAAHNNEVHFGAEALNSFWAWHAAVVDSAARRGCTVDGDEALVGLAIANAVSEHYLEDLFAPGHVAAFRDTMHDIGAALIHDRYNSRGAMFHLNEEVVRRDLLSILGEDDRHLDEVRSLKPAARKAAVDALRERSGIYIFGDNGVDWSFERKGGIVRNGAQRLLQTLLAARSMLDVLYSYAGKAPANSFKTVHWEPQREVHPGDVANRRLRLGRWKFPYGEYEEDWGIEGKGRFFGEYVLYHGLALGISAEGEGFLEGVDEGGFRKAYRLEVLPGFLAPGRSIEQDDMRVYRTKNNQIALVPGYEYVDGNHHHGHGPTLRVVVSIPKIDLMLSAIGGYRWLAQKEVESGGAFYGVRGELGFSLLTLYGAYYLSDHFIDSLGVEQEAAAVSFGFTLSAPVKRLIPGAAKRAGRKMYRE